MKQGKQGSISAFGGSSLLAAFGILCLVVLAMLSITSVQADRSQSQALAESTADYYAADRQAQTVFARLRLGETLEGVSREGDTYRFRCSMGDTQVLEVVVQKAGERWQVLRWQAVSTMAYTENETLPVWDGS